MAVLLCAFTVVLSFDASVTETAVSPALVKTVSHAATATPDPSSIGARSEEVGFSILSSVAAELRPSLLPQDETVSRSLSEYFTIIVQGEADSSDEEELLGWVITLLPEEHLGALNQVFLRYDDPDARRGLGGGSTMILRAVDVSRDEFISLFVHELGHSVDLGMLGGISTEETEFYDGVIPITTDDPSLDFYRISWASATEGLEGVRPEDFVSGYAASDAFEDFAESYVYYVLHGREFRERKKVNNTLAKKYEFIKMLFVGQEFDTGDADNLKNGVPWDITKLALDASLAGEVSSLEFD